MLGDTLWCTDMSCVFNRQNQNQLQTYWYTRDSGKLSKDPNYWLSNSHQDDNTSLCTARPTRALTTKPCSDAVMQWELGTVLRLSSSCPATALTAGKAQVAPNSPGWHCLRTKSNHRSHLHPKPTKKKKYLFSFSLQNKIEHSYNHPNHNRYFSSQTLSKLQQAINQTCHFQQLIAGIACYMAKI